jgi:Na+-translocating ferredoxin:NAD+ oxidoreductase RnfD subunit
MSQPLFQIPNQTARHQFILCRFGKRKKNLIRYFASLNLKHVGASAEPVEIRVLIGPLQLLYFRIITFTCKVTLWQVFICLRPPPLL